jgi:hypothetical protein
MRHIKCINIVVMSKSAKCTFFILTDGGLARANPGFAACPVLGSDGHLATASGKVYD